MARWLNCIGLIAILAAGASFAQTTDGVKASDVDGRDRIDNSVEDREFPIAAFDRVFISGGATIELLQGKEIRMTARGDRRSPEWPGGGVWRWQFVHRYPGSRC